MAQFLFEEVASPLHIVSHLAIVLVAIEGSQGNSLREAVVAQILVHIAQELIVTLANETKATTQTRKSVELTEGTRDNQVAILVHQWSDVSSIHRDKAGISLVNKYHRIRRNILHDATRLLRSQSITSGVVGRCQQQHTGMNAIGEFNHLVYVIGEGVFLLVQGIHLKGTTALRGYTIVIPPRELRNQNLCIGFAGAFLAVD